MKLKEYARHIFEFEYYKTHKAKFFDIKNLHNKNWGGTCFIVCNGPSLTASDLDKLALSGIESFGTNRIYNIYKDTIWRPTYVSIFDQGLMYDKESLRAISEAQPKCFFLNKNAAYTARDLKCNLSLIDCDWSKKLLKEPNFSINAAEGIYGIGTVTYSCIQIAYYLGFRKIYIIGADNKYPWTHMKDGSHKFDESLQSYFSGLEQIVKKPAMGATWEMNVAYDYAESLSKELGLKIYNATRGGNLNSFERIDFETAIEREKNKR